MAMEWSTTKVTHFSAYMFKLNVCVFIIFLRHSYTHFHDAAAKKY